MDGRQIPESNRCFSKCQTIVNHCQVARHTTSHVNVRARHWTHPWWMDPNFARSCVHTLHHRPCSVPFAGPTDRWNASYSTVWLGYLFHFGTFLDCFSRLDFERIPGCTSPYIWYNTQACIRLLDINSSQLSSSCAKKKHPNVSFHKNVLGSRVYTWNELLARLQLIQLSDKLNEFWRNLHQNGKFSVKPLYETTAPSDVSVDNKKNYGSSKYLFEWRYTFGL